MDVMTMARSIGLVAEDRREVSGTIEETTVLEAIAELAATSPAEDDLYADAAMRVQLARSAGTVHVDELSILHRLRDGDVQLRYRSEMADLFTDLAIDVGMRRAESLADTPA